MSLVKSIGGGVPDSNVGCLWYVVALGVAYNVIVKMCASSLGRSLSLLLPHIEADVGLWLRQTCVNIVLWHFRMCVQVFVFQSAKWDYSQQVRFAEKVDGLVSSRPGPLPLSWVVPAVLAAASHAHVCLCVYSWTSMMVWPWLYEFQAFRNATLSSLYFTFLILFRI